MTGGLADPPPENHLGGGCVPEGGLGKKGLAGARTLISGSPRECSTGGFPPRWGVVGVGSG